MGRPLLKGAKVPHLVLRIDKQHLHPYSFGMSFTFKRLICLGVICVCGCFQSYEGPEKVREADELTRAQRYDEAIALYRAHMEERLSVPDRPQWENPYFYLLLIGDVQLGRGQVDAALATYQEAEREHVDAPLISDRYRAVGRWYEEHGELQQALDVLSEYRDRDPLLFDVMLDRIAKELTAREDGPQ